MKARILCLLLLSACSDEFSYDYALRWICQSPDGCERAQELALIDRLNIVGDVFVFLSSRDEDFFSSAQQVASDSVPAGCFLLYSLALDADELEPSKACNAADGYDLELSIPNRNPATHSQWLVEARDLGLL